MSGGRVERLKVLLSLFELAPQFRQLLVEFPILSHDRDHAFKGETPRGGSGPGKVALPPRGFNVSARDSSRPVRAQAAVVAAGAWSSAARAWSAIAPKACGSRTAMSARIFRSISSPAFFSPSMNVL